LTESASATFAAEVHALHVFHEFVSCCWMFAGRCEDERWSGRNLEVGMGTSKAGGFEMLSPEGLLQSPPEPAPGAYPRPIVTDDALPPHMLRLRNQERVELIMAFYRGLKRFRELTRRSTASARGLRFEDLDDLIESHFRRIKDSCHRLFRESRRTEPDRLLQASFDMYFGILFHILLKAKENLRLRENYNVRRLEQLTKDLERAKDGVTISVGERKLFERLTEEFARDSEELAIELQRAHFMLDELEKTFNRIIQAYDDNATIIRNLYCQKEFFADLFPGEGIERVLRQIYGENGPADGYFLIGFDYLRSGHIDEAREAFMRSARAARKRHMSRKRLRGLYNRHREQALIQLGGSGDAEVEFRKRLCEMESQPPLCDLIGEPESTTDEHEPADIEARPGGSLAPPPVAGETPPLSQPSAS
jgi:hypothetical protein